MSASMPSSGFRNPRKARSSVRLSLNKEETAALAATSILYQEVVAEREEIARHKWLLSEKVGHDIGFNAAAYDWIAKHRTAWRKAWRAQHRSAL